MNNKYGKFLTVILVITIVAIVGLLCFFGYDMYRKYFIDKDAQEALEEWDKGQIIRNVTNNNIAGSDDEVIDPFANTTYVDPNGSGNQNNTTNKNTTTYKGYQMLGKIEIPKTNVKYPILEASKGAIEVAVAVLAGPRIK